MDSFIFQNPTKIIFGKDSVEKITDELSQYGPNILLAYGGGSIKRNGLYQKVIQLLHDAGKHVVELPGIMSNPRTTKVDEGILLCKKHHIDFILAVGGGSTIDCVKAIAAATLLEDGIDYWEHLFVNHALATRALPFGSILTMAATGSEMNCGAVISHWEKQKKMSFRSPVVYPKFSILDPTYTLTLPHKQMVYGIVDMMSHLMEAYFSTDDKDNVSDDLIISLLKTIIKNARIACLNDQDYTARSNLMWAATLALNGLTGLGKTGDWMSHQIEHALSAYHDIPHGAGLAIVHPMLLKYTYAKHLPKFVRFAKEVWDIPQEGEEKDIALSGIQALQDFFKAIGAPTTLKEVDIPFEDLPKIASSSNRFPTSYHNLQTEDILAIYESAYE